MRDFTWYSPTRFIFRKDAVNFVGAELASMGIKRVLLVYGQGSVERLGTLDKARKSLEGAGIQFAELAGVRPNPEITLVRQGIEQARSFKIDMVVALGGGSVIDCAKAVAAGYGHPGDVWEFFDKTASLANAKVLPIAAVLTIPAAGSEASNSCVISNDAENRKCGMGGDNIRPQLAFMDPVLTYTLPPYQTAAGATDMVAHICERWFSGVGPIQVTDEIAAGLIRSILNDVPVVLEDPEDYDARSDLMWIGTLAHNGLAGLGRAFTYESRAGGWVSHALEHEISAVDTKITHGAGLAVIMPAWMRYVCGDDPQRFIDFGRMVFGFEAPAAGEEKAFIAKTIDELQSRFVSWGMPANLTELGLAPADIDRMIATLQKNKGSVIGSFRKLSMDDVRAIYESAF